MVNIARTVQLGRLAFSLTVQRADTELNSDYDFNYGVWGMYKFSGFAVGARISGESQQLTFGIDF